jgi:ABC-type uncharacterized transport system substrate-binding protein
MKVTVTRLAIALAVLLLVVPLGVGAQPATHRIGVLAQDLQPGLLEILRDELQRLGYTEGRNATIEVRNAAGRSDRLPALVDELLRHKVGVIVAVNTPAAQAAKKATSTVPKSSCGSPIPSARAWSRASPSRAAT